LLSSTGWRLRPNASCFVEGLLPVSGTKSLLVQLGTVHELFNEVEHSSFSISSFLFADSTQLRATLLLSIYVAIYFFSVVSMYYHMTTVRPVGKGTPLPGYTKRETCPEDEILQSHSYLSWLCVTWLSPMVARLGHSWNSAMSKCSPDEVPPVNGPEFQAFRQCERFEALWEEEVRNRGQEEASILRVVCKLWGYQRLFWFHMSLFVHVVLGNLYQVFLIQMSLSYFFWLQEEVHQNNGQLPDMTKPILVSIAAFSAQPLVFAILCSFEANLSMKFDQCIAGVAVAMFKKTQRLPASVLSQDKPVGSEDQHQLAEKVSKKPNAMMTINNDVIGNFHGLTFNVSLTINATVTVAVLLVLMAFKLRLATLFCLAVAIPALTVSVILSGAMGINMMQLQDVQDKRVYLLREVLKGIRIVKCYAWESAMEEQIKRIRGRELSMLGVYFRLCSHFVVLFNLFPRVLTAAGLWGFLHLYGSNDLASIFACLQILASLRAESSTLSGGIQRLITVRISAIRVENYLKQEEAPVLPGVSVPKWVDIWPRTKSDGGPQPSFKIRGSYLFCREKPSEVALHDLNLEVKKGEMVALVGGVGSGKSLLLEAALGELHPASEEKAFLSRPHVCGYSAQVPHIAEGTVRDNVVFGQEFNEERYRQAVAAAGLESDLKLLPGGDEAFIGARGISLSGGQRARLSLARSAYNAQAELVLLDDPFGSVDAPTALGILEDLLCGPLLKDRARIVALQPEVERLRKFDRVFVMSRGRIVASGTPSEEGVPEEFKQLLRSSALEEGRMGVFAEEPLEEGALVERCYSIPLKSVDIPSAVLQQRLFDVGDGCLHFPLGWGMLYADASQDQANVAWSLDVLESDGAALHHLCLRTSSAVAAGTELRVCRSAPVFEHVQDVVNWSLSAFETQGLQLPQAEPGSDLDGEALPSKLFVDRVKVDFSSIHGCGVFAVRDLAPGELVELAPTLFLSRWDLGNCLADHRFSAHGDQEPTVRPLGLKLALGLGSVFNHKDAPNVEFRPAKVAGSRALQLMSCFAALREIKAGEELFISYGPDWWASRNPQQMSLADWRKKRGETDHGRPFYDDPGFEKASGFPRAVVEKLHEAFVHAPDGDTTVLRAYQGLCQKVQAKTGLRGLLDAPLRGSGERAAHAAVLKPQNLRWLVLNGADVNAPTAPALELAEDGSVSTALCPAHVAAINGQVEALSILHSAGADLNCQRTDGATPLDFAVDCEQTDTEVWLKARGAVHGVMEQ
ncbi:ABCC2, partial [Symbiodinium necroappetens]